MNIITYIIIGLVLFYLLKRKVGGKLNVDAYTLMIFVDAIIIGLFFEYVVLGPLEVYLGQIQFKSVFFIIVVACLWITWKVRK